jgi:hypothetical protein
MDGMETRSGLGCKVMAAALSHQSVTDPTGLVYDVESTGAYGASAYVTGYAGTSTSVTVPAQLGGADVVSVTLNGLALISFDAGADTALKYLSCAGNALASLDISKNNVLTTLWCANNRISNASALTAWLNAEGHVGSILPQNVKIDITKAVIASIPDQTYTGSVLSPAMMVTLGGTVSTIFNIVSSGRNSTDPKVASASVFPKAGDASLFSIGVAVFFLREQAVS